MSTRPTSRVATARPTTARPTTTASSRFYGTHVVAIFESRGISRQVGVAALERDTSRVVLTQVADCQTYVKTLNQLSVYAPQLILVPDTVLATGTSATQEGMLLQLLADEFPAVPVEPVLRKYWNESAGLNFVNQLCADDADRAATVVALSAKYYALSAASALFKHTEVKLNTIFAEHSLRIKYIPAEGTVLIDTQTGKNLELVDNILRKKSTHSLFGLINHTWTPMASRLLRANLLAPLTVQSSIDARLDVVEELAQNEEIYSAVKDALKAINKVDIDKLISSLACSEARETKNAKPAATLVGHMLALRNVVRSLPLIHSAIRGCKSQLLKIIANMVADSRVESIDKIIQENVNEDAMPQKGGGLAAISMRVYAVKSNRNRLLDVARETYRENVGDIHQLARTLSSEHELPIEIICQDGGFAFSVKKTALTEDLPRGFVNVTSKGQKWVFSSLELQKRNARAKDSLEETLMLSDKTIRDIVSTILEDVGVLYKASEAVNRIALLDILWSFAHISIVRNYVRPEFTDTLAIKAGRHPILESVHAAGTVVANDVYCCDASSFQLVQGPNMSGKSTYLRQVALLCVMATCGCFVPAEYASFRLHDSLLTRLSNDDDLERGLSTFANEITTSAMILGLATNRSLILLDELGRGTSPGEGVGISHAISEKLINTKAFVFFATHFDDLALTLSKYPSVVNLHLAVQQQPSHQSSVPMIFQYKIVDGSSDASENYGLQIAKLADLPPDVLSEGYRIAAHLRHMDAQQRESSEGTKIALRRKALLRLRTQLQQAAEHSTLQDEDFLSFISGFQREVVEVLGGTLRG